MYIKGIHICKKCLRQKVAEVEVAASGEPENCEKNRRRRRRRRRTFSINYYAHFITCSELLLLLLFFAVLLSERC